MKEKNNDQTKEKKKSIDIKALMNTDLGTLKAKLSKGLKKANKISAPEKKRKVVAFDIGSSMIKIVEGMYYKEELTIDKYITMKTPKGAVVDGEIKRSEELFNKLGQVLKENGIKAKYGICTTNSTLIINREILVPKVEEEEMDTVVRYEIQQYLPINLEDYILQVQVLSEEEINESKKLNVRVIAYPDKIARGYYDLLIKLDLKPYALDVNYNAINKFINCVDKNNEYEYNPEDSVAFIDMGASFIDVNIYKNGNLDFTRMIKAGGNDIDELLIEQNLIKAEEVEGFKIRNIDLEEPFEPINIHVREITDDWTEKIEKIIQFYKNKNMGEEVSSIVIFGGSSKLKGMDNYMTEKLGIKTIRRKGLSKIAFKSSDDGKRIDDFINVIGSVIRL
ncbi:pilus assembly protein PilM [Clostridium beijerinckii]|jgi:type IV pilus assembly protein PilM|uniref:Pilus assembly protein PilM n=2 Tax=Clostridium beijerinckii TaxID=1520 RepID=A0A1S8QQ48_CLOBE|nr:pilus assembly protein PilM [Clostridium beijerinckii]ABR36325.1 type IV pilus assembly protein PilM [Clostridium beijerinckii NCIMB 8052]AIU04747.1 type IV pilus assembly protein PilM [Clostridium beijerinckii ATCC 35702]MBF7809028.1 pilus assembly protein PilM [Clostridium beijerinckii]NRT22613.1 type IV pilus assembly protein PilM [Clostridium beijerinckii]NRT64869.1 type IV pilus assembly protein PilM [Clostridium beijerinckii]